VSNKTLGNATSHEIVSAQVISNTGVKQRDIFAISESCAAASFEWNESSEDRR
jgi:hypothetical protein